MSNKAKLFVIYHRPDGIINSGVFQPITVGNYEEFSSEFLRDNVGDNIASKNAVYNEMTGIYWVFKHLDEFKDAEYIGFCHYRRLFCFDGFSKTAYVKKNNVESLTFADDEKIQRFFRDYDFVAPIPSNYKSVRTHFEKNHNKDDLNLLRSIIKKLAPEYLKDAKEYFDGSKEFLYNMFIMKKSDFIEYGNFVFPILEEFEKNKKTPGRLFVSERLTGIFLTHLINKGSKGLLLPILHIRSKSLKVARKQVQYNYKLDTDRGFIYKSMPLILCLLPRFVEQYLRRKKTK